MTTQDNDDTDRSVSENMAEIQANIESIERTWRRWGLPAIIVTWFLVGVLVGLALCGVSHL